MAPDLCGSAYWVLSQGEGLSQGLLIVLLMMQLLTIGASSLQRRRASLRSMVGPLCKEVTIPSCRLLHLHTAIAAICRTGKFETP